MPKNKSWEDVLMKAEDVRIALTGLKETRAKLENLASEAEVIEKQFTGAAKSRGYFLDAEPHCDVSGSCIEYDGIAVFLYPIDEENAPGADSLKQMKSEIGTRFSGNRLFVEYVGKTAVYWLRHSR